MAFAVLIIHAFSINTRREHSQRGIPAPRWQRAIHLFAACRYRAGEEEYHYHHYHHYVLPLSRLLHRRATIGEMGPGNPHSARSPSAKEANFFFLNWCAVNFSIRSLARETKSRGKSLQFKIWNSPERAGFSRSVFICKCSGIWCQKPDWRFAWLGPLAFVVSLFLRVRKTPRKYCSAGIRQRNSAQIKILAKLAATVCSQIWNVLVWRAAIKASIFSLIAKGICKQRGRLRE